MHEHGHNLNTLYYKLLPMLSGLKIIQDPDKKLKPCDILI